MAWTPISNAIIQYSKDAAGTSASGYYLKFYESGTSTPFSMASASDGSGLLAKCQINSLGYPINGSGAIFTPYIDRDYRAVLYTNSTDADANTFASAVFDVDGFDALSGYVTKTELAAAGGSGLVGYNEGGTGAVDTTVQAKIREKRTAKDYGATGDGTTDDRAAVNIANTAGPFTLTSGTYSIQSALTISSDVVFEAGAKLKPASGITITITGAITANAFYHIFDMSAGGSIQFEIGIGQQAYPTWFGAISDDESGTISSDNVTAIDACIKACNVATGGDIEGDPVGVFRNIPVLIPAGMFSIDNANIDIPSYCVILGLGDSSILACKNSANSYSVFRCATSGANSIYMSNFAIYGDQANQTGTIHGIEFNVSSGAKPIYNNFERLMIKEMSGNAVRLVGSVNLENSSFNDCMFRDSKGHNIYIARANSCDFNGLRVRSAKTGSSGIVVDGTANYGLNFNDCRVEGNNEHGLFLSNTGGRMTINGGSYSSNLSKGIYIDRADNTVLDGGITIELNTGEGITIDQSDYIIIGKGVLSRSNLRGIGMYSSSFSDIDIKAVSNQQEGILISAVDNSNIKGSAIGNSQATHNTYNGVMIQSNSDNNNIEVFVRHGGGAAQHKYGVEIADAPSTANRVTNCDLLNSGATGSFNDLGTSTVTTSGNRV